jgi:hypothetical protein
MPGDQWSQYAEKAGPPPGSDPWAAFVEKDRSAASPIPPPAIAKPSINMHPSFLIGDPDKDATPQSISDVGRGIGKNLYQISAPGIAASVLHKHAPGLVSRIPQVGPALEENATPIEHLPAQATENFALAGIPEGEAGEIGEAQPEAARSSVKVAPRVIAKPSTPAAPAESTRGVIGRAGEVALRRAGHIPGVQAVKDIGYIVRGPKAAVVAPVATPAPIPESVPETNGIPWGSGGEGPLDLRGRRIPEEPPELTTPSRTLPGQIGKEVIGPHPQAAAPIPPRPGLMLPSHGDAILRDLAPYADRILREGHGEEIPEPEEEPQDIAAENTDLNDPDTSLAAWKKNLAAVRAAHIAKPKAPSGVQ